MVKSTWARCDWCHKITHDINEIFVLSCDNCGEDNEYYYFHENCINAIYDEEQKKIDDFFANFEKIECRKCLCQRYLPLLIW